MKITAKNIVKTYRNRRVVDGISLDVKQGEIVGLLGPNGAGKTTSFYMIVGLVKPNEGQVYLDDEEESEELGFPDLENMFRFMEILLDKGLDIDQIIIPEGSLI